MAVSDLDAHCCIEVSRFVEARLKLAACSCDRADYAYLGRKTKEVVEA